MTTAATAKRGPYAPTRKRREAIAAAVLELVDEIGHEGVTTALVSKRSGVGETTVLYHFPTKDHLLVAALERIEDTQAEESGAYKEDTILDAEAFGELATVDLDDRRNRLFLMLRGQSATPDHPAAAHFAKRTARQVDLFARLIVHSQQAGRAHPGLDPVTTARQVIAVWDGLTQVWMSDPTFDVAPVLVDAIQRLTGQNLMEIQAMLSATSNSLRS
ncbi:TetR/AcrR family transcriptional regulator [Microbacterium sp. cf046]|uniref:TetR/AcrR family transcriptional regulator n=1 Tax=Microbacterium sp. cf046 TaxID=1761803 RepID=UPI000B85F441|nr:TetR family transcriptional regulator [Microbacterium sp. cf046]